MNNCYHSQFYGNNFYPQQIPWDHRQFPFGFGDLSPTTLQPQNVSSFFQPGYYQQPGYFQQQTPMVGDISPSSIQPQFPFQPQPIPFQPQPFPFQPQPFQPGGGGCLNKVATVSLEDGRTMQIFVTSIGKKSLGGFIQTAMGMKQIALGLDEIASIIC
ncbi:hypothetical protein LCL95_10590 [Bacillus timonensis]|nr:hypothetical protein [Bacillus timonensis]